MSLIEINNLSFSYDDKNKTLENIDLEIESGEKVAIIGQNGAGKTTLVKMLNGLLKPSIGDVIVSSLNTKKYTTSFLSKYVGYIFQNPDDQIFHDNVFDEIAFAPQKAGLTSDEINKIVLEVAKVCGLSDLLDKNPYDLPYSMRKFVAIASIMALNPKIIILDEPTAGQDKKGMEFIEKIISYLQAKNKTVITITHSMEFTVKNFDRIIVMANKKKIADGSPEEIFFNDKILDEAKLKKPYISRVATKCKIENIISIEQFIKFFDSNYSIGENR